MMSIALAAILRESEMTRQIMNAVTDQRCVPYHHVERIQLNNNLDSQVPDYEKHPGLFEHQMYQERTLP